MAQYLKPDCELGYIEDVAEIERQKINNLRHTILGCMLGDFNEVGSYIVSKEIVNELISMEKYIVQTYDNIELCKSALKLDKQISFMVTFEGNRATLSLVEKINYEANYSLNSGKYNNLNEFLLDSVETNGEIDRNVLYRRWNIKTVPGEVVDIFNCEDSVLEKYFGIVNRFKYLLHSNRVLLEKEEKLEEIEAEYANNIFEIISHYPKLQEEVNKAIKIKLNEAKNCLDVKKPYFAKTLNEVLENVIKEHIDILPEDQQKEFETEKRNAVVKLNVNRTDVLSVDHIQNDNGKDFEPKIIKLNTAEDYASKTVQDLGSDLIAADKAANNRIKDQLEEGDLSKAVPKKEETITNKAKLINHLIEDLGVESSIGLALIDPEKDKETTPTVDVSKTKTAQNTKPNVKAAANTKADSKGKSSDKGKSASKPKGADKAKGGAKKADAKADNKDTKNSDQAKATIIAKLYSYVPPVDVSGALGANDSKVEDSDSKARVVTQLLSLDSLKEIVGDKTAVDAHVDSKGKVKDKTNNRINNKANNLDDTNKDVDKAGRSTTKIDVKVDMDFSEDKNDSLNIEY